MYDISGNPNYYIHYDQGTGRVKGFFDTNKSGYIPYPSLEVSYEVYDNAIRQQNRGKILYIANNTVEIRDTLYSSFDRAKRSKLNEINLKADEALSKITSIYPMMEIVSWYKQELEAVHYRRDPTYPTPMIDAIALYRNIDKDLLIDKILQKSAILASISGATFGRRQNLEDTLQKAKTLGEINSIRVSYEDISSMISDDVWQYN